MKEQQKNEVQRKYSSNKKFNEKSVQRIKIMHQQKK